MRYVEYASPLSNNALNTPEVSIYLSIRCATLALERFTRPVLSRYVPWFPRYKGQDVGREAALL